MKRMIALITMLALIVTGISPVWSQSLFQSARGATPTVTGRLDSTGVTVRGGIGLRSYVDPATTNLLEARARIGGTCGSFDVEASLRQMLETIPGLLEQLLDSIIANVPMLALCYASPTLCDLAKHFQAYTNLLLQARFAQCNQIQTAMAAGGLRLRGGQAAKCLEAQSQQGTPLEAALGICLSDTSQLRNPFGQNAGRVDLVKETLEAAGAAPFLIDLAGNLIGEVTLSGGGNVLNAQAQRPSHALHGRYEIAFEDVTSALTEAVEAVASGGQPPETLYHHISTPGQPLPQAALEALVTLRHDPVRFESFLHRLASGLALTRLTWEVHELQSQLSTAGRLNPHLSDEERRQIEASVSALRQDLARLTEEKETAERHVLPVVSALLTEHAAVQRAAATVGLDAPSAAPPPTPFGGQVPLGYRY